MASAAFRALVRSDAKMVAGMASLSTGAARFFIVRRGESDDEFIGRVAGWIKQQGAEGLSMSPPDVLPEGVELGKVMMRLRAALGARKEDRDADEFDVQNSDVQFDRELAELS